jgi:uncharacterized Tic20 family protein
MMTESRTKKECNWGIALHLSMFCGVVIPAGNIIVPLVIWLTKREESDFLNQTGKAVLNFQITVTIFQIIFAVLTMGALAAVGFSSKYGAYDIESRPFLLLSPFAVLAAGVIFTAVFSVVCSIAGAVRASSGRFFRYPGSIRFLK